MHEAYCVLLAQAPFQLFIASFAVLTCCGWIGTICLVRFSIALGLASPQLKLLADLRAASYVGSLPPEWAFLPARTLSAPYNSLTGTLPDMWFELQALVYLRFQGNQLTGVLIYANGPSYVLA